MTTERKATDNSRLPQWGLTWLIEVQCFYQHLCLVDSEVLRNPPLRQSAKRRTSCGAEFNNKSVMRFILTLSFFICAFQSCLQNSDKGHRQSETSQANSLGKEHAFQADTNRLIVLKEHFVISTDGQSKRAYTKSQLLDILKEYKSRDTLYLTIKDAPSRQLEDALKCLRELEIKTYKVEVSEDYFKLPY